MTWWDLLLICAGVIVLYGVVPALTRRAGQRRIERMGRPPDPPRPWVLGVIAAIFTVYVVFRAGGHPWLMVVLAAAVFWGFSKGLRRTR